MLRKGGKGKELSIGDVVILAIPQKNLLSTEATCLCYKVLEVRKNNIFPIKFDPKKRISIAQAATLQAGRKSILAIQKEGRKANQKKKARVDTSAEGDIEEEVFVKSKQVRGEAISLEVDVAEAIVVQDECDEQFATEVEAAVRKRGANLTEAVSSSPVAAKRRRTRNQK
ncbi:hypothetical protein B0J14DRAFT_571288 [Halenospora varia]|nr:hypothetical protein B0J14DRAFT_571288 [Halenospora varia]